MAGVDANQNQADRAAEVNALPPSNPDRPNKVYRFLRFCLRVIAPVYLRYRARGIENVPLRGPALLVVNHQSFLDPVMAGLPFDRPLRFLGRDTLFRGAFLRAFFNKLYTIPLSREAASSATIRKAVAQLQQGFLLGIFPEGTRSTDGQIGPLKPGFIALVRRANAPIVPVGVAGTGAAFPRGARFVRPSKCRVVFGAPLEPEMLAQLKGHGSEEALLERVREAMTRCYDEAREWQQR